MIQKVELDIGDGRILSLETGQMAKEAGGAVITRLGDTMVLSTATISASPRPGMNFFPLLVDFEEKLYAIGKIPGGFFKREGRPTESAILTSRRVDRPIRPLFPDGFRNDVQITVTPLSVDQENPPDVLANIGSSAALCLSDIPFDTPIAGVRVARVDGKFILFPTTAQMQESSLDLVVAGTKDKIMMIEAGADEVPEKDIVEAIKEAHQLIKKIIKLEEDLTQKAGKKKIKVELHKPDARIDKFVREMAGKKIEEISKLPDKNAR
ncbi:MAG: polyribonucleotide nucleotidyltransferase, partial [Candidatus Margulisbacteria bacterium]|nr:polyribonucleotide nucleotidyltransferase [Candidatus Margulisiibacteriota bacterium]